MEKRSVHDYVRRDGSLENLVFRRELWGINLRSSLTQREKTILKMYFIEGYSLQEIATQLPNLQKLSSKDIPSESLCITSQAVSVHLRNAYKKLARLLPTKGIKPDWMDVLHTAYLKELK